MSNALHIANGMNGSEFSKLTKPELIAAFYMADNNLAGIKTDYRYQTIANMSRIADEMYARGAAAKGKRRIEMFAQAATMQAIVQAL